MAKFFPTGIFKALGIVWKNTMRRNIVIQYPWEKYEMPERARWAVHVKRDEEGHTLCQGCLICEKACPIFAINIDVDTDPETRDKHINHWHYDRAGCMMCGLCVESCPFDVLYQDGNYELAHSSPDLKHIDLVTDEPAAKPKRKAAPAKPAAGADKPAKAEAPAQSEPAKAEAPAEPEPAKAEAPAQSEEGDAQ